MQGSEKRSSFSKTQKNLENAIGTINLSTIQSVQSISNPSPRLKTIIVSF